MVWKFADWSETTSMPTLRSPKTWSRMISMHLCSAFRDGLLSWKRSPARSTMSAPCCSANSKTSRKVTKESSPRTGSRSP